MTERRETPCGKKSGKRGKKAGIAGDVQKTRFSVTGYFAFVPMVALIAVVSVAVYEFARVRIGAAAVVLTGAGILFLALLLSAFDFVRRKNMVEKPLRRILDGMDKIIGGDFTVRFEPVHIWGKYDEYDVIMENLNRMAEELSKTETFRADFIANVSHEIKTPLSVIGGYASALRGDLPEETRKEYAETIVSACRRLTELVTNILKLNKMENSELFPEKTEIGFGELLRKCVLSFEDALEKKGIELEAEIDDVTVLSDEGFLEIIFNNLLSNAVKFTDAGGKIRVTARAARGGAEAVVSDTGCGMTAETGARIFDKFYQGDPSRAQEGNGLGLALVKRAIDVLGGEISVRSEIGKGSTFTVFLRSEAT